MEEMQKFNRRLDDWRQSLPVNLRITNEANWNSSKVWLIMMHSFSFQLEVLFYHNVGMQESIQNQNTSLWINQRKLNAVLDWSSLLRRAMVHDMIQFTPPSLYVFPPVKIQSDPGLWNDEHLQNRFYYAVTSATT
jgi:hypothetical protein